MKIEVLGMGCQKCATLYGNTKQAVAELGYAEYDRTAADHGDGKDGDLCGSGGIDGDGDGNDVRRLVLMASDKTPGRD